MDTDSSSDTISEATFLVTELRYTLGQLHVQLGDMDEESRAAMMCGDRSAETVVQDLLKSEADFQRQYARVARTSPPQEDVEVAVPLPLGTAENDPTGLQPDFEQARSKTLDMLEGIGSDWPSELVDLVKQQVSHDREVTSDLAQCKRQFLDHRQRTDLNEPLAAAVNRDDD